MKHYKIVWKDTRYGESYVEANSVEEAHKKAKNGEDQNFSGEELDLSADWKIDVIIEIKDV